MALWGNNDDFWHADDPRSRTETIRNLIKQLRRHEQEIERSVKALRSTANQIADLAVLELIRLGKILED